MSGNIHGLCGASRPNRIRTYIDMKGTPASDAEQPQFEEHRECCQNDLLERLSHNMKYMEPLVEGWERIEREASQPEIYSVSHPTASKLQYHCLNPFIYRRIGPIGSLDDLSAMLESPPDWAITFANITKDCVLQRQLDAFRSRAFESAEASVQAQFMQIVTTIAARVGIEIFAEAQTPVEVGGFLARYDLNIRGDTDCNFPNVMGRNLVAAEAKSAKKFAMGEKWYHSSRGVQVLLTLYAFNAPTFLFTQQHWKLFVENDERTTISTYPFSSLPDQSPHVNSCMMEPVGISLLKTIMICLLSTRGAVARSGDEAVGLNVNVTPAAKGLKRRIETVLKPIPSASVKKSVAEVGTRRSQRLLILLKTNRSRSRHSSSGDELSRSSSE